MRVGHVWLVFELVVLLAASPLLHKKSQRLILKKTNRLTDGCIRLLSDIFCAACVVVRRQDGNFNRAFYAQRPVSQGS